MNSFWYISLFFSLFLYLHGFFPVKNVKSSTILYPPSSILNVNVNVHELYKPKADRVILLVIDALRMDFVNNKSMPFVTSILRRENNCILETKVETPTVTLPRIKAMTTGSVPQFIDVLYNFASTEIMEDSFLHRAKDMKKNITFYGDDTWIKLYPNMFLRSEGVTSFFVTDYTEVDNNVTRHIKPELTKEDWSILILHYLGLDHIGHIYGPFSPLIHRKLLEMDRIIENIYKTVQKESKRTVLIICGDHGMKDSGGHGGSSYAETTVPLIFLGLDCKSNGTQVKQTDIAATISTILGIPLPAHSIGTTLPEIFVNYNVNQALYIQYYNSLNLLRKFADIFSDYESCHEKHLDYLVNNSGKSEEILAEYNAHLSKSSKELIKITTTQNIPLLYISICISTCCLLKLLLPFYARFNLYTISLIWLILTLEILLSTGLILTLTIAVLSMIVSLMINLNNLYDLLKKYINNESFETLLITGGTVVKTLLMSSTSFIEEEHQIWYFFWGTYLLVKARQAFRDSYKKFWFWVFCFVSLRFIRTLNQVGDKWAHIPDVSDWLNDPEHWFYLYIFFIVGVIGTFMCCWENAYDEKMTKFFLIPTFYFILSYGITSNILSVRLVRLMTVLIFCFHCYNAGELCMEIFKLMWILWTAPLLRPHNLVLLPFCYYLVKYLNRYISEESVHYKTLVHMWLSMMMMFAQGICNSIASIDIAPGYVGLQSYSPIITAFQIVSHICTFPVLSYMILYENYYKIKHKNMLYQISKRNMLNTLIICQVFNIVFFCILMLIQRNHLFIWTVFSPKLLIESLYTFILLFIVITCNFNVLNKFKTALIRAQYTHECEQSSIT